MLYEHKKHDGSLPIIGVNTFRAEKYDDGEVTVELSRATEEEKRSQIDRLAAFHERNKEEASAAIERVKNAVTHHQNGFEALVDAARYCSLGQITDALFEVGGQYRRSM
jgi:methylmalonyl-CoA mutase